MHRKKTLQGVFWILVYLLLTLAPLAIILAGPRPEGRELWREFSVALGFVGLAMMALQFVLTARFKTIKSPYGADVVYYFHRQISLVTFALILAHPLLLFIFAPQTLRLLNIFTAPWRARAGVTALVALAVLIAISIWRKQIKLEYNRWRVWHGLLAIAAVTLAMMHILLVGHYMNTPLKQALWLGYGLFWVFLLLYVRLIKPFLLQRKPYEVVKTVQERGDSWTLVLKPIGHPGMSFMPGQFAWLTAWASPFSDQEHPFSFSSSAACTEQLSFTIKERGDFTRKIKEMSPGQRVYLDGPFGAFSVDRHPHANQYVFIAGGIGISPMMSMLRTLADRQDQRPLTLIYGNRDWESVTFREEIEAFQSRLNLKVVHVLENPPEGWKGESGLITYELLERYVPSERNRNDCEIFICGPKPMMDAVETALSRLGVYMGDYHSERFDLV